MEAAIAPHGRQPEVFEGGLQKKKGKEKKRKKDT